MDEIYAFVVETLACEREPRNIRDRYAVAVKKDGKIISHLPRIVSRVCLLFMRRGGSVHCTVPGTRRYSPDLPHTFSTALTCGRVIIALIIRHRKLFTCLIFVA